MICVHMNMWCCHDMYSYLHVVAVMICALEMYRVFASASADNPHPRIIRIVLIFAFISASADAADIGGNNYSHSHLHFTDADIADV